MKKKEEKYVGIFVKMLLYVLGISILVFLCIYIFDKTDFPSRYGFVNAENSQTWLKLCVDYFGSVVGSFVGFAGAIVTVLITIKKQNENRKEDSRKNVLPLIKVKDKVDRIVPSSFLSDNTKGANSTFDPSLVIDYPDNNGKKLLIKLSFKNIGQREMYDIWVGGVECNSKINTGYVNVLPILYKGEEYMNCLSSVIDGTRDGRAVDMSFKIYFRDCYDNWYYQSVAGRGQCCSGHYVVDRFIVNSAPVLVEHGMLPEAIVKNY